MRGRNLELIEALRQGTDRLVSRQDALAICDQRLGDRFKALKVHCLILSDPALIVGT